MGEQLISEKLLADADYLLYRNIEDTYGGILDSVKVSLSYQEEFEKNNIIIKFPSLSNIGKKYNILQQYYFTLLLESNDRDKILQLINSEAKYC